MATQSTAEHDTLQPRSGPQVWYGPQLASEPERWTYTFSAADIDELDAAIDAAAGRGLDVVQMRRDDFPLPTLGPVLAHVRAELVSGRGFQLMRGLPVQRYSPYQAAIAFFGIGTYLGDAVSQNARGHALGHVKDLGFDYSLPTSRGYQTSARLPYHTDGSDLVGLLCLQTAKRGGLSSIVSSSALYNEMLERRPDLVAVLTQPLYRDRRGEIPDGALPWYRMPVFNLHRGNLLVSYVRSATRKAQRFDEVPRLTAEQEAAMDLIDELAADPALHLDMRLERGDLQFVNNHVIMHSRTAYQDHEDPARRRHLLRLWLACKEGPPLPEPYAEFQGLNADGRPNGYWLSNVALNAPLTADDGGPGESAQRRAAV